MGYYRTGGYGPGSAAPVPPIDIGYSDPEVPIPDPLASDETRWSNVVDAYDRMMAARKKESEMGYYRAGDAGSFGVLKSDMNPAPSEPHLASDVLGGTVVSGGSGKHYRRMNVGNVRALRRSMRRVQGFAHLAKRVMTFTAHHKMKKRRRK